MWEYVFSKDSFSFSGNWFQIFDKILQYNLSLEEEDIKQYENTNT